MPDGLHGDFTMQRLRDSLQRYWLPLAGLAAAALLILAILGYTMLRIDVPAGHVAVLVQKTGADIANADAVAPDAQHKGLQLNVLTEGRYFYNPYYWEWNVYPMVEVPAGKMGVRVRLYGDNLPYGHFLAKQENQKGIVPEVLRPGRYPINAVIKGQEAERPRQDYVEIVELFDPVTIPAGFRGVVTNLAGTIPDNPNTILVDEGFRGVQKATLDAGTYYLNPYAKRVNIIDCRSQRYNLASDYDMGFPSKDGFWVSLDGIIEFRVKPEKASEVFVLYNEQRNDHEKNVTIHDEIVKKMINPSARSFCRLRGSDQSGRDFIGGETRTAFQKEFQREMQKECEPQGIEIVQALITRINPPQAIAKPVRDREVARQRLQQFKEQKLQQDAEAKLATEKAMIDQRQALVQADLDVVRKTTEAKQKQQVAVTKANEKKAVAQRDLEAAKDQAAATMSRKKAEASIVDLENSAEAAGWQKAIEALGGDGDAYARFVLYQKLAPAFRSIMTNTADSPLMEIFRNFEKTNGANNGNNKAVVTEKKEK
jgi:regulator of protease activity HflC (stomatin/prohibitin superfamily)